MERINESTDSILCSPKIATYITKSCITLLMDVNLFNCRGLFLDINLTQFLHNTYIEK